ncbi:hypothetical protein ACFU8Q_22750 [Streptomyces sp. NPDC057543]|uniref:hypothetical protein n=1 Tax=Streptomyces sp. NPDC057543 TaxID=3346163 RepID=UPI003698F649
MAARLTSSTRSGHGADGGYNAVLTRAGVELVPYNDEFVTPSEPESNAAPDREHEAHAWSR